MKKNVCGIKMMAIVLVSMLVRASLLWAVDHHVLGTEPVKGTVIVAGDRQFISRGHVAIQTTVEGKQIIYPDGRAQDTIIQAGGNQWVQDNGRAEGTTIREGGEQLILRNGKAECTTIYSCGRQWVSSNGTVEHTTILKGGRMRFWSAGRIRGIDNFGLVEATDSVMNTIEDYIRTFRQRVESGTFSLYSEPSSISSCYARTKHCFRS
jgi:autotransporter passenger strand-loop-strand repeat protein